MTSKVNGEVMLAWTSGSASSSAGQMGANTIPLNEKYDMIIPQVNLTDLPSTIYETTQENVGGALRILKQQTSSWVT
jgi:hypothetical protein